MGGAQGEFSRWLPPISKRHTVTPTVGLTGLTRRPLDVLPGVRRYVMAPPYGCEWLCNCHLHQGNNHPQIHHINNSNNHNEYNHNNELAHCSLSQISLKAIKYHSYGTNNSNEISPEAKPFHCIIDIICSTILELKILITNGIRSRAQISITIADFTFPKPF